MSAHRLVGVLPQFHEKVQENHPKIPKRAHMMINAARRLQFFEITNFGQPKN